MPANPLKIKPKSTSGRPIHGGPAEPKLQLCFTDPCPMDRARLAEFFLDESKETSIRVVVEMLFRRKDRSGRQFVGPYIFGGQLYSNSPVVNSQRWVVGKYDPDTQTGTFRISNHRPYGGLDLDLL